MKKEDELTNPQSCLNSAEGGEILFVLRAKDPLAAQTVRLWCMLAQAQGLHADRVGEALRCAEAMDNQQRNRWCKDVDGATPAPVLQPWVWRLPMMQQTVLLTAVRGPDGLPKYGPTKYLLRWYRRSFLYSAMARTVLATPFEPGGGSFTGPAGTDADIRNWHVLYNLGERWEPAMDHLVGQYLQTLDAVPHHFQLHLMHGAEILGYKHPDERIRHWWQATYLRLVRDMHLNPETEEQMNYRLGDNEANWRASSDEATQA